MDKNFYCKTDPTKTKQLEKLIKQMAKNKLELGYKDDDVKIQVAINKEYGTTTSQPKPFFFNSIEDAITEYKPDFNSMFTNGNTIKALEGIRENSINKIKENTNISLLHDVETDIN